MVGIRLVSLAGFPAHGRGILADVLLVLYPEQAADYRLRLRVDVFLLARFRGRRRPGGDASVHREEGAGVVVVDSNSHLHGCGERGHRARGTANTVARRPSAEWGFGRDVVIRAT